VDGIHAGGQSRLQTLLCALADRACILAPNLARLGLPNSDVEDGVQEVLLAIYAKNAVYVTLHRAVKGLMTRFGRDSQ
jgi:hypothetical protein